jgi:hypothetical protein
MRTTQSVVLGWINDAVSTKGWLITDLAYEGEGYLRMVLMPSIGVGAKEASKRTPVRSVKFSFSTHEFSFRTWMSFDPAPSRWVPLARFTYPGGNAVAATDDVPTIEEAVDRVANYLTEG